MKKRFISMLLVVLMVMSLFTGVSTSASAAWNGANTIDYTMQNGDYVLRICQKLGLNYYTCKSAIMALNNINEGQWNKLAVGRVLTLPASDQDAILITTGAIQTVQTTGAAQTTGTATTGNTAYATTSTVGNTVAKTADVLGYYLVPYTMSLGDTVSGVCNSLGVNFSVFQDFIKQVNDISSWNKVRAGQTLIIPTPVQPSVGTSCYGVMVHTVTSNETAYSITGNAGVNYNANKKLLEALNQTNNLGAIKAGQKFFYPVAMTVSVPGTGNPGSTATTTTTTSVTDGNGTTVTQTTTTAKLYKLISNLDSSDGTMLFYVNNQAVTAAQAGAKVTIETATAPGKAIQGLTVKHSDGKADLNLTADTFIMPSCDVRVDASIKTGHDITIISNYSGKANATVGGISVQSAIKGAAVVIKSVDPNYEIQSITAYYKKLVSSSDKTALTVSSSKAFIMPDADVTVELTLKPVSTYAFYVNDPVRGSFYLQVNGNAVTRAAKGAQVTVVTKANEGYEPISLSVTKHGDPGTTVNVFSNTFTMPAFDVDVEVKFGAKGNNILIMPSQLASVFAFDDSTATKITEAVNEADTNATVYLIAVDDLDDTPVGITTGDYEISYDVVRNSDGLKVKVENGGLFGIDYDGTGVSASYMTFKMPKGGVTVTPTIISKETCEIISALYINGKLVPAGDYQGCSFSVSWNNKTSEFTETAQMLSKIKQIKREIPVGEYIDLRFDCNDGMSFVKYRITDGTDLLEEETNEANLHGYFKMPDEAEIIIEAYFETGKLPINYAAITGVGSVGYKDKNGKSINSAMPGDLVTVNVVPGNGHKFDDAKYETRLMITRSDNGVPITLTKKNATTYTFTMPDVGVNVQVIFEPKPFVITMRCVDQKGNDLSGLGLWQIAINGVPGVMDNSNKGYTKVDVAYGDNITVAMTEAGWSNYNMTSFRIDGNEYIAYVLNYFYNFQMLDRWAKDLEIVATLQPSIPYSASVHSLNASYTSSYGGVEFVILESPTNYNNDERVNSYGQLNYIHKAYTGDKVAIVVNSNDSKYSVKQGDVTVTSWFGTDADYIVPTEGWHSLKDGDPISPVQTASAKYHIFYFTMPDGDATANVNFTGTKQGIKIHVLDNKTGKPIDNMIQLQVGGNYYDVAGDWNFADVPFGSQIQLWRSNQAISENKIIVKSDIQTKSGPVSYFDLTGYFAGVWFNMPNEDVEVYLYIDALTYYNYYIAWDQVYNGKLVFRKTDKVSDPVCNLSDFAIGETVYVWGEPDFGYDYLGIGELKIMNGVYNLATLHKASTAEGPIWKFTLPNSAIIFQASFPAEQAETVKLTVNTDPATATVYAYVNGSKTEITGGSATLTVIEGQEVSFASATEGYSISTMSSGSGKGVSGTTYTVPADLTPLTDTLTVNLVQDTYQITWKVTGEGTLEITDGTNYITAAQAGATVHVTATHAAGYKPAAGYPKVTKVSDGSEIDASSGSFTMPGCGVHVEMVFEADNTASVTFDNKSTGTGADAIVAVTEGATTVAAGVPSGPWTFTTGTSILIAPVSPYDSVHVWDGTFDKTGASVTYTVSGTATVYIEVKSSAKAVTLNLKTDSKYGTIGLAKSDSKAVAEPASAFSIGNDIWFFDSPVTGYELDMSRTKVTKNIDKSEVTYSLGTQCYNISGISGVGIPEGGITIDAYFKAKEVSLSFSGTAGQIKVSNGSSEYTIDVSAAPTLKFSFGDTITMTPVGGYSWDGTGVSASGVTISGSGDTSSRSFKISAETIPTLAVTMK